jgi:polar amino acid transport system substrate-binding protein
MRPRVILFLLIFLALFNWLMPKDGIAGTLQDVKVRGKLIAGVRTDFPPFGFVDKLGTNMGLDVDIAKFLVKGLVGEGGGVNFVSVIPSNRISFLTSRKVDILLASMSITEERKKAIEFSIPYFLSGHLVLVHRDSAIAKYQDLAGKKVATIKESTGDRAIQELVPAAQRVQFQRNGEALQALKERSVEAFVQDDVLIYSLLQENPDLKVVNEKPFKAAPYGLGVRKGDPEWLDFINATLTKMRETGEHKRLLQKWFGKAMALVLEHQNY